MPAALSACKGQWPFQAQHYLAGAVPVFSAKVASPHHRMWSILLYSCSQMPPAVLHGHLWDSSIQSCHPFSLAAGDKGHQSSAHSRDLLHGTAGVWCWAHWHQPRRTWDTQPHGSNHGYLTPGLGINRSWVLQEGVWATFCKDSACNTYLEFHFHLHVWLFMLLLSQG